MPSYNLNSLGSTEFERLVQALLKSIIGPGTTTFGAGRDGGREATFTGEAAYPSDAERWQGSWIFQAKFHDVDLIGIDKARAQVLADLDEELHKITDKYRHRCDNYILVTNVPLSGVFKRGTIDRINNEIAPKYASKIKNIAVWGADDVQRYLEQCKDVRTAFLQFIVPGDLIAELMAMGRARTTEIGRTIRSYLSTSFTREQYAQLDQAGDVSDDPVRLQQVFFDLVAEAEHGFRLRSSTVHQKRRQAFGAAGKDHHFYVVRMMVSDAVQRVVLVGGPGEGKSTLGQYLAQLHRATILGRTGEVAVEEEYVPTLPRLPFRVILKDYGQWLAARRAIDPASGALEDYISEVIATTTSREITPSDLHTVLAENPCLLVLDGLDEVTDIVLRRVLMERITEFTERCTLLDADVQVLATTRPTGYSEQFDRRVYPHLRLVKLQPQQVQEYVSRWVAAKEFDHSKAMRIVQTLDECLADPQVSLLTTTPLQVTILALIISSGGSPPRQREALFDEYLEVIYKRETAKGRQIIQSEKQLLLGLHKFVGYILHEDATEARAIGAVLPADEYEQVVNEYLSHDDPYSPPEVRATELRGITKEPGERLVLLVEPSLGYFGFELRSIQEFFAAAHLVDTARSSTQRSERFDAIARLTHWRNVALFFAGRMGRSHPGEIFDLVDICREIDRTHPDSLLRRGSELALELAADRAFGPKRRAQRALIEHAILLFEADLSDARANAALDMLKRLPQEDVRDHVRPILAEKATTLDPDRLAGYLTAAQVVGFDDLCVSMLKRMAERPSQYANVIAAVLWSDLEYLPEEIFLPDLLERIPVGRVREIIAATPGEIVRTVFLQLLEKGNYALLADLAHGFMVDTRKATTDLPSADRLQQLLGDWWHSETAIASVSACEAVSIIEEAASNDRRRDESRELPAVLKLLRDYKLPKGVLDGPEAHAMPHGFGNDLLAPIWTLHFWIGNPSRESVGRFARWFEDNHGKRPVREFLASVRRPLVNPALDLAIAILGRKGEGDRIAALVKVLPYSGAVGTANWLTLRLEVWDELSDVVRRFGRPTKGETRRSAEELASRVREVLEGRLPVELVGHVGFPRGVRIPSGLFGLQLVEDLLDSRLATFPRLNAAEFAFIRNPEIGPVVTCRLLEVLLDQEFVQIGDAFLTVLAANLSPAVSCPEPLLRKALSLVGLELESSWIDCTPELLAVATRAVLDRLAKLATEEGDKFVRRGAQILLMSYAASLESYDRANERLPVPRFAGFAQLHRDILRSEEPHACQLGFWMFQFRPAQTPADFDAMRCGILGAPTADLQETLGANIKLSLEAGASVDRWIELLSDCLKVVNDERAAVVGHNLRSLMSNANQSLGPLEVALGLPLQD
ncbi:NACHT domain-containing protein [Micromonospora sp. WMMD737]|uniref:NACHT domain-containing protein n=1 Tax=Micromonospora sp. WMMD737 TaxID=3404113 RepID=UPI003B924FC6